MIIKTDILTTREQYKLGVKYIKTYKIFLLTYLLLLFPLVCFLSTIVYGVKHLFSLVYCILVMVLLIPTIFIFYNEIASIYVGMYGVISIVGNLLGSFVKKYFKIEREKMIE